MKAAWNIEIRVLPCAVKRTIVLHLGTWSH